MNAQTHTCPNCEHTWSTEPKSKVPVLCTQAELDLMSDNELKAYRKATGHIDDVAFHLRHAEARGDSERIEKLVTLHHQAITGLNQRETRRRLDVIKRSAPVPSNEERFWAKLRRYEATAITALRAKRKDLSEKTDAEILAILKTGEGHWPPAGVSL